MTRLVTFNLYHDKVERAARIDQAAHILKDLKGDIVALQEVATGLFLVGDPIQRILAETGTVTPFVTHHWSETNLGVYRNGLTLLSRYPIVRSDYHGFTMSTWYDRKGLIDADVITPDGPLRVVALHMRSSADEGTKADEFDELADLIERQDNRYPLVVMGDFNWDWHHPIFRRFADRIRASSLYEYFPDDAPRATWTPNYEDPCNKEVGGEGGQQLDNILVAQGDEGARWTLESPVITIPLAVPHPSDHCPISAELRALSPADEL